MQLADRCEKNSPRSRRAPIAEAEYLAQAAICRDKRVRVDGSKARVLDVPEILTLALSLGIQ